MPGIRRTTSKPAQLSEAAEVLRKLGREYPDAFIEALMMVVDPLGHAVEFKYQYSQRLFARNILKAEQSGKPVREWALKRRQVGFTTLTANRNFVKILCNDNRRAATVAQQDKRAGAILQKLKFAYSHLPEELRFELSKDSKDALQFADFGSQMDIISAMNIEQLARGDTAQDIHLSEFTRYKDQERALYEVQQICHYKPTTSIIIETTGKLYGSYAHKHWLRSKAGLEPYNATFYAWQDDPECDMDKGWTDKERDMYMTEVMDYEPMLMDRAKLFTKTNGAPITAGNIYWSYRMLKDQCNGNWEDFLEDYPMSDEEAWRSKGDLFFDSNSVMKLLVRAQKINYLGFKLSHGHLEDGFENFGQLREDFKLDIESDEPKIVLWSNPRGGRQYIISGDSGSGSDGGDPSATHVIDKFTGEMMCEMHGLMKPHQHARLMASLGRIFNNGVACPEVNSMGLATLQDLMRLYPNIFIWRSLDDNKQKLSNKLGWYTGTKSRQLMLALLHRVVEEAAADNVLTTGAIKSIGLLNEMRTFIEDPYTGKPEAAGGCHDDRIISLAIGWYVAQLETRGARDDILGVLRPKELQDGAAGLQYARGMNVEDSIEAIKKQLRLGEYGNNG